MPTTEGGQFAIPCCLYRGGTSKGAVFLGSDLPADAALRNQLLLAALNPDHPSQIDGVGGAESLSNKVVIVSPSRQPNADVDYKFIQLTPGSRIVRDDCGTSGNMTAVVGPFALEHGLVEPIENATEVRIFAVDSGMLVSALVQSPAGKVTYEGGTKISGVERPAAPVFLTYRAPFGNLTRTGIATPTGACRDVIDGTPVTVIDAGGTLAMIVRADAVDRSGYESKPDLDADDELAARLEAIRQRVGRELGLPNIAQNETLGTMMIAPPRSGGTISSRKLSTLADSPARCHAAHSGSGAICLAVASAVPGSVAFDISTAKQAARMDVLIEHPSGSMAVSIDVEVSGPDAKVVGVSLVRTCRKLFEGNVYIPAGLLR